MLSQSGEVLGEVEDLRLSLRTGRVEEVVILVDAGILDLCSERFTVSAGDLSLDPLEGTVRLDGSVEIPCEDEE